MERKTILCFGDSLTAGYGFTSDKAYPGILQKKLDEHKLSYEVLNAGVSGETTREGLNRIARYLHIPMRIFILELGINDMFRGVPVATIKQNLRDILQKVRDKHPDTKLVLAGMQMPFPINHPNINGFIKLYPDLAEEFNATLIPFFLRDVMGVRALNLPDGLHPNHEGYKIIAETVFQSVYPLLA